MGGRFKLYILIGAFLVMIVTTSVILGTAGYRQIVLDKVVDAFDEEGYINTFHGEGVQKEYIDGELVQSIGFEEWKGQDNCYRINVDIHLNDDYYEVYTGERGAQFKEPILIRYLYKDNTMTMYYPTENKYCIKKVSIAEMADATIAQGINQLTVNGSAKDYVMSMISDLTQECNLTIEDDVKLNGRITQHIIAIGKNADNLNARYEYWIDQQSWLLIKAYKEEGNYSCVLEYKDYRVNPKIAKKVFKEQIKEDTKVIYLGNNYEVENEEIPFSQVQTYFDDDIYYLEEKQGIKLVSTKFIKNINEGRGRIECTYKIPDNREIVVQNIAYYKIYDQLDPGYEHIDLGRFEGDYYESGNLRDIQIIHNDTMCDIYVKNGEISKGELIALAKKLEILPKPES